MAYNLEFYTLSYGACRTAIGGSGSYTTYSAVSLQWCLDTCLEDNSCDAAEYVYDKSQCEVHKTKEKETIVKVKEKSFSVGCYIREILSIGILIIHSRQGR